MSAEDYRRSVDRQLVFSRWQLDVAEQGPSALSRQSCMQAAVLQLSCALDCYLSEITPRASGSAGGFTQRLAALDTTVDFRLQELRLYLGDVGSWLNDLLSLASSCTDVPLAESGLAQAGDRVGGNGLIASTAEHRPIGWDSVDVRILGQILESFQQIVTRHRDLSIEQ